MRVFLSHSSRDKEVVIAVHEQLGNEAAWLDRAEIEWGDYFLERVGSALEESTDFVLFWSANSAQSEWVRIELHMAFIRMMESKAIRLRVIRLDDTELPLYLKPFQFIDVSASRAIVEEIVESIRALSVTPRRVLRYRFLNRHDELSRMEAAIDDPETYLLVFRGFAGIGKQSLAREGLQRFFEGSELVVIDVTEGTGVTELALYLNTLARGTTLGEGLTLDELKMEIRLAVEEVARSGRFLLLTNAQHWLDDDRNPVEPLTTVLDSLAGIPAYKRHPCLMTSTRRPSYQERPRTGITEIWVDGLPESSVTSLLKLWYELETGSELEDAHATTVAQQLHGHPIAAKLAAGPCNLKSNGYRRRSVTSKLRLPKG